MRVGEEKSVEMAVGGRGKRKEVLKYWLGDRKGKGDTP